MTACPQSPDRVDLWIVFPRDVDDSLLTAYRPLLRPDERAREARFHFAADRRRHVIARALVRTALSRYAAVRPEEWRFSVGEFGRPAIAPGHPAPPLSFNLSHTTGMIVLAVRQTLAVGVDVESLQDRGAPLDVADRFFAPDEIASLHAAPPGCRGERFFEYWTLKESYLKARGTGLSLPLDQFSVRMSAGHGIGLSLGPALADDPARWRLWQLRPSREHVIAVCAERAGLPEVLTVRRTVPLVGDEPLPCAACRDSEKARLAC